VLLLVPNLFVLKDLEFEKLSAYECGFDPFEDTRTNFDVQFYVVAMLFILFDIEIVFLLPWALCLGNLSVFGFWTMYIFLFVLTVGFLYECSQGALSWE
jgi:NADH-quinone oxidoreductase subunit A